MKKLLIIFFILIMSAASAEDKFLQDYNDYADFVYGIPHIECIKDGVASQTYKNEEVSIFRYAGNDNRIAGKNDIAVISAACCVFRCIDNPGDRLDQYGRIMHAYFLAKARADGQTYHAVTHSGYTVLVQINDELLIQLVK